MREIGRKEGTHVRTTHRRNGVALQYADRKCVGLEVIRKSADAIKRVPGGVTIEIGGHTDNTSDAETNLALSQARAEAVKAALVSAGVSASMLRTKGYGNTRPRATNGTEFGRFQNRRIEYTLVQWIEEPCGRGNRPETTASVSAACRASSSWRRGKVRVYSAYAL